MNLRDSYYVKTKASVTPLFMYMYPYLSPNSRLLARITLAKIVIISVSCIRKGKFFEIIHRISYNYSFFIGKQSYLFCKFSTKRLISKLPIFLMTYLLHAIGTKQRSTQYPALFTKVDTNDIFWE